MTHPLNKNIRIDSPNHIYTSPQGDKYKQVSVRRPLTKDEELEYYREMDPRINNQIQRYHHPSNRDSVRINLNFFDSFW